MAKTGNGKQQRRHGQGSRVILGESLDLDGVTKLYTRLTRCAEKDTDVGISAGRLRHVDTATLQVLLAFVRKVRGNGHRVTWHSPSGRLVHSARLLGIDRDLGLEQPADCSSG